MDLFFKGRQAGSWEWAVEGCQRGREKEGKGEGRKREEETHR